MVSDAEFKEYWETYVEKRRKQEQGIVDPERPIHSYENFLEYIKPAKTIGELVDLIDKFDPYNYRIINIYNEKIIYIGIKIFIQFDKDGTVFEIPRDKFETLDIKRTSTSIKKYFTVFKRSNRKKKDHDNRGSIQRIDNK